MPLTPTTTEISLARGLDLKTDPKLVDANHSLTLDNVRFPSMGGVDKRFGQSKLSNLTNVQIPVNTSTTIQASKNLLNYNQSTAGDAGDTSGFTTGSQTSVWWNRAATGTTSLTSVTSTPYGAPFQGTNCLHFTSTAPGDSFCIQIPCTGNTTYTFSVYYLSASSGFSVSIGATDNVNGLTGTGSAIPVSYSSAGVWQRISIGYVTAVGATQLQIGVDWQFHGGSPNYYVDALQVEQAGSASTWVSGIGTPVTYTTYEQKPITQGKALASYNGEWLEYDGSNLYGFSQTAGTWLNRGAVTEVALQDYPIGLSSGSARGYASAVSGNYMAFTWEVAGVGCYYAIQDLQSTNVIVPATLMPQSVSTPQVFAINGDFYFVYIGTASILGIRINGGAPWEGPINGEYTFLNGTFSMLGAATDGTYIYTSTVDPSNINFTKFSVNPLAAIATQSVATLTSLISALGLMYDATTATLYGTFLAPASSPPDAGFIPIPASTFTVGTPIGCQISPTMDGLSVASLQNGQVAVYMTDGRKSYVIVSSQLAPSPPLPSPTQIPSNLRPASTLVSVNGTLYGVFVTAQVNAAGALSQQATYFLCVVDPTTGMPSPVFRFYSDVAGSLGPTRVLPTLVYSNSTLYFGASKKTALRVDATGTLYAQTGIYAVLLTVPAQSTMSVQDANGTALINVGNCYSYDGSTLVEDGFWEFPDGISYQVFAGQGAVPAGTVFYQFTYEWVDAAGNIHYSAPSYAIEVNTTTSSAVRFQIPYLALTLKQNVTICGYRAAVNTSAPLYKFATVANVNSAGMVTITDTFADAQIQGQQFLYAPQDGSGEIENDAPPPFRYTVVAKTRAFGIPQDAPFSLWFSKPLRPGRPVEWSSAQVIQVEHMGGEVTGLGYVNTYAVVLKEARTYYLPGDGPDASGANGSFGTLQTISTTGGCINAASIVNTSDGCIFETQMGLALLAPGSTTLTSTFGLPVQPLVKASTITSAQVCLDTNTYRWFTAEGTTICYDYLLQLWYTHSNWPSVSAAVNGTTVARLASTGRVYFEDATSYLDDGQPVTMTIETAHLKLAALTQGFGAVWYASLLGTYYSAHNLQIEVEYDYMGAPQQVVSWNATQNANMGTYGSGSTYGSDPLYGVNSLQAYTAPYQLRVALQRQVCGTIKFKIYDTAQTGRSCALNTLTLMLGVMTGVNRVPSRQQA